MGLSAYWSAARPKMGLFALLLVLASARAHGVSLWEPKLWLVGGVFAWATVAVVALNDYVDREHDRGKGRTLASDAPEQWLRWTVATWGLLVVGCVAVGILSAASLWWLLPALALGAGYSWLRKVPYLSGVTVSLTYALSAPLAASVALEPALGLRTLWLTLAVGLVVYGRETIADVEDLPIDRGYKATLPVRLGAYRATQAMALIFALGAVFAALATPWALLFMPLTLSLWSTLSEHPLRFEVLYKLVDWQTLGFVAVLLLRG